MLDIVKDYVTNNGFDDNIITILKKLYSIDLENVKAEEAVPAGNRDKLLTILKVAIEYVKQVLPADQTNFFEKENNLKEDDLLDYLIMETLFQIKIQDKTKTMDLDKMITAAFCGTYKNKTVPSRAYNIYYKGNAWEKVFDMSQTGKHKPYDVPYFLYPVRARLLRYVSEQPYTSDKKIKINNDFIKFFTSQIYPNAYVRKTFLTELGKNLNDYKKPENSFRFYLFSNRFASKNKDVFFDDMQTRDNEILCYYFLDRLYDIDNMIYISSKLKECSSVYSKKDLVKLFSQTILIPDAKTKRKYIDLIFDILNNTQLTESLFLTDPRIRKKLKTSMAYAEFDKHQYSIFLCNSYIRFLSNIYYPLLSACFFVIYMNTYGDGKLLEEYLISDENQLLDSYIACTNVRVNAFNNLGLEDREHLSKLYECIRYYFFNQDNQRYTESLTSINYLNFNPIFIKGITNAVFNQKLGYFSSFDPFSSVTSDDFTKVFDFESPLNPYGDYVNWSY